MAERPKHRRRGEKPRGTPDAGSRRGRDPLEEGRVAAEVARTAAETTRERAERARARAEEDRDLAEEMRRSTELRRLDFRHTEEAAEHAHQVLESAVRGEASIAQRLDALLAGVGEMSAELKRLRGEAAELRQMLSAMQQAAMEQRIIAGESQVTQRRMERERFQETEQSAPVVRRAPDAGNARESHR